MAILSVVSEVRPVREVVWKVLSGNLDGEVRHLNSIEPSVQFTLEAESEGQLAFLDIYPNLTQPKWVHGYDRV